MGPLSRVNNCFGHLPVPIHLLLQELNINFPTRNMYHSIIARAVEIYFCVLESIRIMEHYHIPEKAHPVVEPRAGRGFGCTEAPRGTLWQHFQFDEQGLVQAARIVPPTSQNQARIEEDLRISLVQYGLHQDETLLRTYSEMIIRNYDPCISCSTHFLTLKVNRE